MHYEDLHVLLETLGVKRVFAVGASMGAEVALELALAYPETVAGLVLCSPTLFDHEWSAEVQRFGKEEDEAFERGDLELATELNVRMWVDGPHRDVSQVPDALRELVREMQLRAFQIRITAPDVEEGRLFPLSGDRLADFTSRCSL